MDKARADEIISEYMNKIYGFSLSKTMNIDLAEELASDIIFEVYKSLLRTDDVYNIDAYIYRIACNVHIRFTTSDKTKNTVLYNPETAEKTDEIHDDNILNELRKEIAYLSNLQREIIVLYYFDKISINEISQQLKLPSGTVKWHLFEARNQIKDGLLEVSEHIKAEGKTFSKIGYHGFYRMGNPIDVSFYFTKTLTHHIAYSAYNKPKTVIEIAKELDMPTSFIADEIAHLVDNGFMKKINNKYLTNILIYQSTKEREDKIDKLLYKYAKYVCDLYIPLVLEKCNLLMDSKLGDKIYIPENDVNFFLWSMISYSCFKKLNILSESNEFINTDFNIEHKDGSDYITYVAINDDTESTIRTYPNNVDALGSYASANYTLSTWEFFSEYDTRDRNYFSLPFFYLYQFISGTLPKTSANAYKYKILFDKRFIVSNNQIKSDFVNMIIAKFSMNNLDALLPQIPEKIVNIGKKLDEKLFNINKANFPKHKQELCRFMNQNSLTRGYLRVYILKVLLNRGVLKPINEDQKKTVNMIMFCTQNSPNEDINER